MCKYTLRPFLDQSRLLLATPRIAACKIQQSKIAKLGSLHQDKRDSTNMCTKEERGSALSASHSVNGAT